VFACADGDTSWTAVNTGLTNFAVESLANLGTYLFAGTWYGGVYRSSNSGANWIPIYSVPGNPDVRCFAVSGNDLYAGTSNGVYLSTNSGADWMQRSSGLTGDVRSLIISGTNLFAGTWGSGLFRSTDNGLGWTQVLPSTWGTSFAVSDTNVFAGTYGGGVFLSTDNGANWTAINSGLFNTQVRSLAVTNSTIYAGTYENQSFAGEVWKRPLSEIISAVEDQSTGIPTSFILRQNYPNPFNPSTIIKYSIPQRSFVSLKIYNEIGEEIATLVNEEKPTGTYDITWNAASAAGGLSSGVYFYQLRATPDGERSGNFIQTRKMILLK
jgi:hypothetical protein